MNHKMQAWSQIFALKMPFSAGSSLTLSQLLHIIGSNFKEKYTL